MPRYVSIGFDEDVGVRFDRFIRTYHKNNSPAHDEISLEALLNDPFGGVHIERG